MIKNYLTKDLKLNKLHNAYLISTDDSFKALGEVVAFLSENFYQDQEVLKHPDFMLVEKIEGNVKNISVDQIRHLQNFLYKTSVISGQKTTVIYNAELMNINAANSCLKILEDTPKNTHIFLITNHPASVLSTIRSRCAKINHNFNMKQFAGNSHSQIVVEDYYIIPFLKTTNIEKHLEYLKDFGTKDRGLWVEFTTNVQFFITRICRRLAGEEIVLSRLEADFLEQVSSLSLNKLTQIYDKIVKLTDDTINFDLDLRASYLLVCQTLKC